MFAAWAANHKTIYLVGAVALMSVTIDAGLRLFAVTMIMPYWWLTPLVAFAFLWIGYRTTKKIWRRFEEK